MGGVVTIITVDWRCTRSLAALRLLGAPLIRPPRAVFQPIVEDLDINAGGERACERINVTALAR